MRLLSFSLTRPRDDRVQDLRQLPAGKRGPCIRLRSALHVLPPRGSCRGSGRRNGGLAVNGIRRRRRRRLCGRGWFRLRRRGRIGDGRVNAILIPRAKDGLVFLAQSRFLECPRGIADIGRQLVEVVGQPGEKHLQFLMHRLRSFPCERPREGAETPFPWRVRQRPPPKRSGYVGNVGNVGYSGAPCCPAAAMTTKIIGGRDCCAPPAPGKTGASGYAPPPCGAVPAAAAAMMMKSGGYCELIRFLLFDRPHFRKLLDSRH